LTGQLNEIKERVMAEGEKKSGGCMKMLGCGCLVVVILSVIAVVAVYQIAKKTMAAVAASVEQYTEEQPMELPKVALTEQQIQALNARVEAFGEAINAGQTPEPLVLEGDEINALIRANDEAKEIAESVYLTIEGEQIKAQISLSLDQFVEPLKEIPLPKALTQGLAEAIEGRYLNGKAGISAQMAQSRLQVYLESVQVGDKPLPEEIMSQLRTENLAKDATNDPETREALSKIESLQISNGRLVIAPKMQ